MARCRAQYWANRTFVNPPGLVYGLGEFWWSTSPLLLWSRQEQLLGSDLRQRRTRVWACSLILPAPFMPRYFKRQEMSILWSFCLTKSASERFTHRFSRWILRQPNENRSRPCWAIFSLSACARRIRALWLARGAMTSCSATCSLFTNTSWSELLWPEAILDNHMLMIVWKLATTPDFYS